jgi:tetratricopeptide (TPR) repeat protein
MPLDAYSPCPCGSGKKFKWCCQAIYAQIIKAFQQDAEGQHDMALKTIDEVVTAHPDNPEAWGRKSELLFRNGKPEEAEAALQKAFELNPNYPYGYYLRGMLRMEEGELPGALLLFRKAAEVLDPEARDLLAHTYALIAECELKLNRPVAMHAALKIAQHLDPADENFRGALDGYFGEKSRLPQSAKRDYAFVPPATQLSADRRSAWDQALARAATGKLSDAAKAFAELTQADSTNATAWYNLALARTWLGDNKGALEALDRYVSLESDTPKAAAAWSLGQVLRQADDMTEQADVLEHWFMYRVADGQGVSAALSDWQTQRRLLVMQAGQDQPVFSALVLERPVTLTAEQAANRLPHLGAYVLVVQDQLRLWHSNAEALERTRAELMQKAGPGLSDERRGAEPANFSDILSAALVFPVEIKDEAERAKRVREELERYFEETWIHQPLRSLGNVPPVDAAGHPVLAKKLAGVVQFVQECAAVTQQPYDFDRLRRKLGLLAGETKPAAVAPAGPDIGAMGTAELAGLKPDSLGDDQLEQAYQSAVKLDAREVAGRFAQALVARPVSGGKADRYPWYSFLVQQSLTDGRTDAALDLVNEGLKSDCEHNEGKRRNDYELRRGQIHAKRGEADQAQDVFDRLIERVPAELKFRGTAAEAMLSAKQGSRALKFAEGGLGKAREQNNRDSEQYFLELVEAAKRQS